MATMDNVPGIMSPFKPQGQICTAWRRGICDPLLSSSINALTPLRYSDGAFRITLAPTVIGGGVTLPANSDGCDWLIDQQTLTVFGANTGVGQTVPGEWRTQTLSDTNFLNGTTGPVSQGQCFVVFGVAFSVMDVYNRGDSGTLPTDARKRSVYMNDSHDGRGFTFEAVHAILEFTNIRLAFGNEGQEYRGGTLVMNPGFGSVQGAQSYRNGLGDIAYSPFNVCIMISNSSDAQALSVNLEFGSRHIIQSDGSTVAGSTPATAGTINAINDGTVYALIRCATVGALVCCPPDKLCSLAPESDIPVQPQ